jgi:hypothetical protein
MFDILNSHKSQFLQISEFRKMNAGFGFVQCLDAVLFGLLTGAVNRVDEMWVSEEIGFS